MTSPADQQLFSSKIVERTPGLVLDGARVIERASIQEKISALRTSLDMSQTTKVTLLFVGMLLSVLLITPLTAEETKAAADGPSPAEQRNAVLRELDMRLQKRQWAEAHALAGQLVERWRGSLVQEIGPSLGRALMGLALAEAGLGREGEAVWHWQEAQNVGGVEEIDLAVYGPPGELLAARRLRWWDEAPRGMTVLAANELGPDGTPPRKLAGSDFVLTGPLAEIALPKWAWIQVVVDKDGRVVEPVALASPLVGVELAALEAVRDWRFEPARRGGEPVAVYYEITLPPRGEVPLQSLLSDRRLRKAHERLLAGDWEGARKAARGTWEEEIGYDHPKSAQALALVALAEAAMGEKEAAICRWRVAQFASPDLYQADLSPLGAAGQILEDHPWGADLVRPERPEPRRPVDEETPVTKPRKIAGGPPIYTRAARSARVQGKAIVEAIIEETGHISQVRLLENLRYGLDLAAMDAVCGWRFEPAKIEGKPVKVYYGLTVNFAVKQ